MHHELRNKTGRLSEYFQHFVRVFIGALAFVLSLPFFIPPEHEPVNRAPTEPPAPSAESLEPRRVTVKLRRGETLGSILARHGLEPPSAHELISKVRPLIDLRRLRPGDHLHLMIDPTDESVKGLDFSLENALVRVKTTGDGWSVERQQIPSIREPYAVRGTIRHSLYQSGTDAGLTPQHIIDLARLLEYDIDFFSDFHPGDPFAVVIEQIRYADGRHVPGKILAAELEANNEKASIFHFILGNGKEGYYDSEGRALRRSFLRAPLSYARISSPFSLGRRHPIFRTVRPHRAIDYAAPAGTPVVAVGSGRVEFSGWRGGYGKLVEIRHAGGYTSRYGHFSRIARGIRRGVTVNAGDVIGYVGQTGHATGPHLHFEFLRRGEKINFLSLKVPRVERLAGPDLERFMAARNERLQLLRAHKTEMQLGAG
ncbi:MAG TPA: peptidoglycan DD-metalloendopeptidase family protein [Candidatus Eisenbacteria bacterium]|nr:peptidoglycan DD-metalloendopeptidase family protein [Candidatus Eisenbacteria bacterium]